MGTPEDKSPPCPVWWSEALWFWIYNSFILSRDLTKPRNQIVMWLFGWEPLKVITSLTRLLPIGIMVMEIWYFSKNTWSVKLLKGKIYNPLLLFIYKAHSMLCSHTRYFTIKRTLMKTFGSALNKIAPILATRFLDSKLKNIGNKTFCQSVSQILTKKRRRQKIIRSW